MLWTEQKQKTPQVQAYLQKQNIIYKGDSLWAQDLNQGVTDIIQIKIMAVVIIKNRIALEEYLAKYLMLFQAQKRIRGLIQVLIQTIIKVIARVVITVEVRGLEPI